MNNNFWIEHEKKLNDFSFHVFPISLNWWCFEVSEVHFAADVAEEFAFGMRGASLLVVETPQTTKKKSRRFQPFTLKELNSFCKLLNIPSVN